MRAGLIKTLLRLYQQRPETPQGGASLAEFCQSYGVGDLVKGKYRFCAADFDAIGVYLLNTQGIDPSTSPDAWEGLSRHQTAGLSANEKMTSERVKDGRVAIKAMPGRPLFLSGAVVNLPDGANLDIKWDQVIPGAEHDCLLVIENWENFEKVHATPLLDGIPGNPLVLYRGDPTYSQKYSKHLIEQLDLPVYAFVDLDPEGLIIAGALPRFEKLIAPGEQELSSLLMNAKNSERFIRQKAGSMNALASMTHPELVLAWRLMEKYSSALPQERFIVN